MIEMIINRIPYDIEERVCKTLIKRSNYSCVNLIIILIVFLILIYISYRFLRSSNTIG